MSGPFSLRRWVAVAAATAIIGVSCSADDGSTRAQPALPSELPAELTQVKGLASTVPAPAGAGNETTGASVATKIETLPPAPVGVPAALADEPVPVSMTIDSLDISSAPISSVGVTDGGDLEVPGAEAVGWYRYGPRPGETGSAVLAAHVAFDGVDGVFRDLVEIAAGEIVTVTYFGGTVREFRIIGSAQFDKDELPFDEIFARTGQPVLTLITCGGDFNRQLSSYDDNIVAFALPV